jgi:hypothetical protein
LVEGIAEVSAQGERGIREVWSTEVRGGELLPRGEFSGGGLATGQIEGAQ